MFLVICRYPQFELLLCQGSHVPGPRTCDILVFVCSWAGVVPSLGILSNSWCCPVFCVSNGWCLFFGGFSSPVYCFSRSRCRLLSSDVSSSWVVQFLVYLGAGVVLFLVFLTLSSVLCLQELLLSSFWYHLLSCPSCPNQRNWFCISFLLTIMVIGLRKPYTKTTRGFCMFHIILITFKSEKTYLKNCTTPRIEVDVKVQTCRQIFSKVFTY